ncbi:MAG: hypothetical protein QI223_03210 [Candidatus Korarchaeota archaeon]|nr:hypothetical protein [Candidatus Korarchaeota archaeon]
MRVRGALLIAITVLAPLAQPLAGQAAARQVRPYLPVLWVYPEIVRQGGEVLVEYNLSRSVLVGGGTIRSTNILKSAEVSLMIPINLPYNITRVVALDPDFNNITNVSVEGSTIRVSAQKIGVVSVRARVVIPLSTPPGDYTIYVRAQALEETPNGTLITVDHSREAKLSVTPWGPQLTLEVQPRQLEPPGTLTIKLTIANSEEAWELDPRTGRLVRTSVPITDSNLTISSTLLGEPVRDEVGPIGPSEVKLVSRSFEINPDVPAGRHTLILLFNYRCDDSTYAAMLTREVRIVKNSQLSLRAIESPAEVQAGGILNLTFRVSNDSPWNVSSAVLSVELGDLRREVQMGPLGPYQVETVSVALAAPGPGNYTVRATITWMNPYPAEELNATVQIPVTVVAPARIPAKTIVAAALAAGIVAAAVRLVGAKKAGKH